MNELLDRALEQLAQECSLFKDVRLLQQRLDELEEEHLHLPTLICEDDDSALRAAAAAKSICCAQFIPYLEGRYLTPLLRAELRACLR